MPTYVVAGVSGHTGAVVAQALLDLKQKVRVLVREPAKGERWKKRGADVAVANVEDPHAMAAALRGADAAYLLIPPPAPSGTGILARAKKITDVFVQTVSGSHLKQVVFLSSAGAQHPDGTGLIRSLYAAEQALRGLKVPITALRAGYFIENWGSSLDQAKGGQLPTFLPPDFNVPMVGTHDVGRVAAELMTDHPKAHRTVELAGPADASANDVGAALSKLLDTEVKVVPYLLTGMAQALQGFGFSAEMAGLYQEMNQGILSRRVSWEHPDTLRRGKETLEQVLGAMLKKG
jgi:uncharacterized protein YbjT (DUF2867 family)